MSRNFNREFSQQNSYDDKYFEERLREAFLRGLDQGRNEGYDNGFIDGQHQGYQDGYDNGYEKCKSKIQDEIQQSYEIGNENGYKKGYEAGYDKREEEINGSTITFYIPSVLRADASTMTMESTEIKITTAHAETMTETTTTYDMIMTTEIEPEHLSTPSTTSYSKLDIESATHILTRPTPNIVLDATNNILPSMPKYVNYCILSTMPSAPTADAPLPSLSTVNNVFSSSPNYQRKTDNSMFTYFSRKKAATSTFSLDELLRPPPGPDICERLLAIAAIFGLSPYKCQDPDTFRGGGDHLVEA